MTLDREPNLGDIIETIIKRVLSKTHTGMPAVIVSYDESEQRAIVQPVTRMRRVDLDGDVTQMKMPAIPRVPVRQPQGGGQMALTFPVKANDNCWLSFSERSIDEFLSTGEADIEPQSVRRFDLADATAQVDVRPFSDPLKNVPTDRARFGQHESENHAVHGPTRIEVIEESAGTPAKLFIGCDLVTSGKKAELLSMFDELLTALETSYVNTAAGPQPILYGAALSLITLCTALRALLAEIME